MTSWGSLVRAQYRPFSLPWPPLPAFLRAARATQNCSARIRALSDAPGHRELNWTNVSGLEIVHVALQDLTRSA
jgi:hypothetical protein